MERAAAVGPKTPYSGRVRGGPGDDNARTITLRDVRFKRRPSHLPPPLARFLAQRPDAYLDCSKADLDLYEDAVRDRRISPRLDPASVAKIVGVARYVGDASMRWEAKKIYPLRCLAHQSKGTPAYATHLKGLIDALDQLGDTAAAQRKRARLAAWLDTCPQAVALDGSADPVDSNPAMPPQRCADEGLRGRGRTTRRVAYEAADLRPVASRSAGQAQAAAPLARLDWACDLDRVAALAPGPADALHQAQARLDGSQAAYDQAIERDPGDALAHRCRGALHWARGDVDAALLAYDQAIELDPHDAPAYRVRGSLHRAQGRPAAALVDEARARREDFDRAPGPSTPHSA